MAGQLRLAGESGPPGPRRFRDRVEKPEFRFGITFADGEQLRLFDTRRLARVRLDPDLDALGPDAGEISRRDFAERVGRGRAPLKARLLDQSVVAGIGNLPADETLWQAALSPARPVHELTDADLAGLHKALRAAIRFFRGVPGGGAPDVSATAACTGEIIGHRRPGGHCPRCGAEMRHGTVGGRSTWWCAKEQA